MAPLAGKPPFATDDDDDVFDTPQPRRRPPPAQKPGAARTSAYDVYDNYLSPGDNSSSNRQSGIEGLGMGFMNGGMDADSDSDNDDDDMLRSRMASSPKAPISKQAALAAAIGASPKAAAFAAPERHETPPPQYQQKRQQQQPEPAPARTPTSPPPGPQIAAPRPGYAAPIAALNQMGNNVARPAPTAAPAGRNNNPNGLRIAVNGNAPPSPLGTTPSPTGSPHPLQAPVTPITPIFARPQRTATMDSAGSVAFSETKGLIMRGDGEETLIPRGRGEKGDQFWRRFSMVAKDPQEKGPSQWLKKNEGGARSHKRWIWIIGVILVVLAAGGIGLGVYMSEQAADHYRPDTLGGSAEEGTASAAKAAASSTKAGKGALGVSSSTSVVRVVTPTNTVARREPAPLITGAAHARRNRRLARLEPEGL
ncbi:hypothetical protein MKEN_00244700 [Mycena kentingensis (nom. inval.)]|nr:hypothetical protein MKEN_00244700 [Mycena kentingensis (nom. inval.)]